MAISNVAPSTWARVQSVRAVYAVVNRLRLKSPIPQELWERAQAEVPARARKVAGFKALGNAWMRENVIPHLAGPPERQVGRVVATSET